MLGVYEMKIWHVVSQNNNLPPFIMYVKAKTSTEVYNLLIRLNMTLAEISKTELTELPAPDR